MIRIGTTADKEHACCLYKITNDGTHAIAILLTGFGTTPIPGAVCDDGIQQAMNFAAHYLQKTAEMLLVEPYQPMDYARNLLRKQLVKLNDSTLYISRHLGQGIYLSGAVCYIENDRYISIHFGRTFAFSWDGEQFHDLTPEEIRDDPYIRNALGGTIAWEGVIAEGKLPVRHQLLYASETLNEDILGGMKEELLHANQAVLPRTVYKNLRRGDYPLAVMNLAQTFNARQGEWAYD